MAKPQFHPVPTREKFTMAMNLAMTIRTQNNEATAQECIDLAEDFVAKWEQATQKYLPGMKAEFDAAMAAEAAAKAPPQDPDSPLPLQFGDVDAESEEAPDANNN